MHNNESTKIYHYIRAGLPVVSESGFPNDRIIEESGLGFSVQNGNLELMADKVLEAVENRWNRESAIRYVLDNHTWQKRIEVYNRILQQDLNH